MTGTSENVVTKIVQADICIGCGICAALCPKSCLQMEMDEFGEFKPRLVSQCSASCSLCLKVCPFNDNDDNEDTLGGKLFADLPNVRHENTIGYYQKLFVGHVKDQQSRYQAASGGVTTEILQAMLTEGLVERVIVPQLTNRNRPLFEFQIVDSQSQIEKSRGSVYYPLQMADVLKEVINGADLTFAITLLPCFAKAVRLAQQLNPKLKKRIKYIVGLTCGGCPNSQLTEVLSCACGLTSQERVKFRSKKGTKRASDFRFVCEVRNRISKPMPFYSLYGFLWLNKFFFHRACAFCDDVFAEVSDVCLMDAWLPKYIKDTRGTSLVICRNAELSQLIEYLSESKKLWTQQTPESSIITSQMGLIKYKRDEVGTRVDACKNSFQFVPHKRTWKSQKESISPAVINARFKCWANTKRQWIEHYKSLLDRKVSPAILRLRTWFFCYRLCKQLKDAHVPVSKKSLLLLPKKVIGLQMTIKDVLRQIRDLIIRKNRNSV